MLERGPKELEFERFMFGEIFNRQGSSLIEYLTCPCCAPELKIECGWPERWFVIHVEECGAFWLLWRDLYFLPEMPLPFPDDIGKNSTHLMRFLSWEFEEGIILREHHGRRFFIDYPNEVGPEWDEFRAVAMRHQEFYDCVTQEMIAYCLQVVSAALEA